MALFCLRLLALQPGQKFMIDKCKFPQPIVFSSLKGLSWLSTHLSIFVFSLSYFCRLKQQKDSLNSGFFQNEGNIIHMYLHSLIFFCYNGIIKTGIFCNMEFVEELYVFRALVVVECNARFNSRLIFYHRVKYY